MTWRTNASSPYRVGNLAVADATNPLTAAALDTVVAANLEVGTS